jgi:hypothetical protein
MPALGRLLIAAGVVLIVAGLLVTYGPRLPFRLGRLPGDLVFRTRGGTLYIPLATCLLLSLVLTLAFSLFRRR